MNSIFESNIPIYPKFREINIEDKDIIDFIFSQSKPYCDYCFINLYIWRPLGTPSAISNLNGNLVIKVKDIVTKEDEVSFLGISNLYETTIKLLENNNSLSLIPSIVIDNIESKQNLEIKESEDNFDYIISTSQLAGLAGYDYTWKRRDINKINKLNLKKESNIGKLSPKIKKEIIFLYDKWLEYKKIKRDIIPNVTEQNAFQLFLETSILHERLLTTLIYDDEKLVAFTFNELAHDNYAIGLFAKGDYDYPGISTYCEFVTADYLKEYGYLYLNYEEDLGIESLRNYKVSLKPINYLKKYNIKIIK